MQFVELKPLLKQSCLSLGEEEGIKTLSQKEKSATSEREKLLVSGKRSRLPVHATAPSSRSANKRGRGKGGKGAVLHVVQQKRQELKGKGVEGALVSHENCTVCGALIAKGRMQFHLFADHQL